jgi:hypothetical protein
MDHVNDKPFMELHHKPHTSHGYLYPCKGRSRLRVFSLWREIHIPDAECKAPEHQAADLRNAADICQR